MPAGSSTGSGRGGRGPGGDADRGEEPDPFGPGDAEDLADVPDLADRPDRAGLPDPGRSSGGELVPVGVPASSRPAARHGSPGEGDGAGAGNGGGGGGGNGGGPQDRRVWPPPGEDAPERPRSTGPSAGGHGGGGDDPPRDPGRGGPSEPDPGGEGPEHRPGYSAEEILEMPAYRPDPAVAGPPRRHHPGRDLGELFNLPDWDPSRPDQPGHHPRRGPRHAGRPAPSERERRLLQRAARWMRRLGDYGIPHGWQDSHLVTFEDGTRGIYKRPTAYGPDRPNVGVPLPPREVAAARLAEELGFDGLVPPTCLWDGPEGPGSLQEWVVGATRGRLPRHYSARERERMAVLDYVMAIGDRGRDNYLTAPDGSVRAVDHGGAFPAHPSFRIYSPFVLDHTYAGQPFSDELMEQLDRVDVNHLRWRLLDTGLEEAAVDGALARLEEILRHGRITGEANPRRIVPRIHPEDVSSPDDPGSDPDQRTDDPDASEDDDDGEGG
jgi:hypothetical protein